MAISPSMPPSGFDELSVEAKLDYVQALWNRILSRQELIASPSWHEDIVEKRLGALEHDRDPGRPWEEVREKLRSKLTNSAR